MRGRVNFLCFTPTQKLRAVAAKMVIRGARVGYNSRLVKDLHRKKVFCQHHHKALKSVETKNKLYYINPVPVLQGICRQEQYVVEPQRICNCNLSK